MPVIGGDSLEAWGTKVPARGTKDTNIVIVGESPGRQEVRAGKPFVGPSGQKLEEYCARAGIDLTECYVTNVCKYMPSSKQKDLFFMQKGQPTEPFMEGIIELIEDLLEIKPNVVVAVGKWAMFALTGLSQITKYRGSILESNIITGLKVVPTLHPTYIMHGNWAERVLIIWDLRRALAESKSPEIILPEYDPIIAPSDDQVADLTQLMLDTGQFTFDTEWYDADTLACCGFSCKNSWALCLDPQVPTHRAAIRELLSSNCWKIAHNAMFDVVYLVRAGYPVTTVDKDGNRIIEDSMVAHFVSWPDIKKGLDTVCSIYTRHPYYKDDFRIWKGTQDIPTLFTYNCKDVVATNEVWHELSRDGGELDLCGTRRAYELNMSTFDIMARATAVGIKGDWEELATQILHHTTKGKEVEHILEEVLGRYINVRSSKQVCSLVFDELGYGKKRARRSSEQKLLMDIAASETNEYKKTILTLIIQIRKEKNALSKYLNVHLFDVDGRLRSMWNMAGTNEGRLSASKDKFRGRGVSLQTMPHQARAVCIADEGYSFIMPDLSQAEARVVATICEDDEILGWLEKGVDIHTKTAEMIFDISYEDVGEKERYLAKRCRHALNYQMGYREFKLTINKDYLDTGIGITERQARDLRTAYLALHPSLLGWWDWIKAELSRNSALANCWGRRRRFTSQWGDRLFKTATAFEPASTVADLNHQGMVRVDRELADVTILVDTHDGSLMQCPEDVVEQRAEQVRELLTIPIRLRGQELVIPVDVEVGKRWYPRLQEKEGAAAAT